MRGSRWYPPRFLKSTISSTLLWVVPGQLGPALARAFPIELPPLRERREDILLLVRHFVQELRRRMKKRIDAIPTEVQAALENYPWPGNIRELQNFLERAVILSHGSVLEAPVGELKLVKKANVGWL
jgi:transcriptional regulator with GAF, ATPase, and Fis domain